MAAMAAALLIAAGAASAAVTREAPIVDGYVVRISDQDGDLAPADGVLPGETIGIAVNATQETNWDPAITDSSGRVVAQLPIGKIERHKPASTEPWLEGSGYPVAFRWRVPESLPSGLYFVDRRPELFFVVKAPPKAATPIVVLLPTNTLNAYTSTERRSLYKLPIQVTAVSFLRPQWPVPPESWRAFAQWVLEQHPFGSTAVSYISDFDMEDEHVLDEARILIVLGHSEYWTRAARLTFDKFIGRGGSSIVAGGNVMWWQTRYSPDHTIMYEYRALADKPPEEGGDPVKDPALKTKEWINRALDYAIIPSIGGDYSHGGYGQLGRHDGQYRSRMTVIDSKSPLLAGLGLADCDRIELPLTGEYDGAPISGLDGLGRPVADFRAVGAYRYELIAYEWNHHATAYKLGTMEIMQRSKQSGLVLDMGARDCCISSEFYADKEHGKLAVQQVLRNAVRLFLSHGDPFRGAARQVSYPLQTPWKSELPAIPANACAPDPSTFATTLPGEQEPE